MSTEYRNYTHDVDNIIYQTYGKARLNQNIEFVKQRHIEFNNRIKDKMNLWDILKKLNCLCGLTINLGTVDLNNIYELPRIDTKNFIF